VNRRKSSGDPRTPSNAPAALRSVAPLRYRTSLPLEGLRGGGWGHRPGIAAVSATWRLGLDERHLLQRRAGAGPGVRRANFVWRRPAPASWPRHLR
jgi:hypothetical protein